MKVLEKFTEGECFPIVWIWLLPRYLLQNLGLLTFEDGLGLLRLDAHAHFSPQPALSPPLLGSHFMSHAGLT